MNFTSLAPRIWSACGGWSRPSSTRIERSPRRCRWHRSPPAKVSPAGTTTFYSSTSIRRSGEIRSENDSREESEALLRGQRCGSRLRKTADVGRYVQSRLDALQRCNGGRWDLGRVEDEELAGVLEGLLRADRITGSSGRPIRSARPIVEHVVAQHQHWPLAGLFMAPGPVSHRPSQSRLSVFGPRAVAAAATGDRGRRGAGEHQSGPRAPLK